MKYFCVDLELVLFL